MLHKEFKAITCGPQTRLTSSKKPACETRWSSVRFQVLAAASMMFRFVFWGVLPCKIIVDRRFRGTCCLHHQGPDDGGITYLWNVSRQLIYTAVHPRRQISSSSGGLRQCKRPRAHWQLQLLSLLVAWQEHTALYDSTRTGNCWLRQRII
jgi:hypothetical protein